MMDWPAELLPLKGRLEALSTHGIARLLSQRCSLLEITQLVWGMAVCMGAESPGNGGIW